MPFGQKPRGRLDPFTSRGGYSTSGDSTVCQCSGRLCCRPTRNGVSLVDNALNDGLLIRSETRGERFIELRLLLLKFWKSQLSTRCLIKSSNEAYLVGHHGRVGTVQLYPEVSREGSLRLVHRRSRFRCSRISGPKSCEYGWYEVVHEGDTLLH